MNKKEFLEKLHAESKDFELVKYYEELIADRIESGEKESTVVASYDIKKIVKSSEFESAKKELAETTQQRKGGKGWVVMVTLFSAPVTIPLGIAFIAITLALLATGLGLVGGAIGGLVWGAGSVIEMIRLGESAQFILLASGAYLVAIALIWIIGYLILRLMFKFYRWLLVKFFKKRRTV